MRKYSNISVLAAIASIGLTAQAAELGTEWRSLRPGETMIQFRAPALAQAQKRFVKSSSADGSTTLEIGIWMSGRSRHPKAWVLYEELDSEHYFIDKRDLKEFTKSLSYFKDESVTWVGDGSTRNAQGKISYRLFNVGDLACGAFRQYWGTVVWSEGGDNRSFVGYFCGDPGTSFTNEELERALKDLKSE